MINYMDTPINSVGKKERETQNRVIKIFQNELGYEYLGNWEDREDNSNVEQDILKKWLLQRYDENLTQKAIYEFTKAVNDQSKSLYDANKAVYSLLRYGV
jgi:type I restriction enzyme R subunit